MKIYWLALCGGIGRVSLQEVAVSLKTTRGAFWYHNAGVVNSGYDRLAVPVDGHVTVPGRGGWVPVMS